MAAPYYVAMQKTAEEVAKEEDVELIWYNAEDDELKQVRQVMSMIGKKIDGLLINPVTPQGIKRAIKSCVDEKIPVVAIDRQLYGDYIAYVGIDQWQAGNLVANTLSRRFFQIKRKSGGSSCKVVREAPRPSVVVVDSTKRSISWVAADSSSFIMTAVIMIGQKGCRSWRMRL